MMTNTIFCFDLDGTISNASGRLHYLEKEKKKDWHSFFSEIENDPPFSPMVNLIKTIDSSKSDNTVILQTGRPENYRYQTGQWLKKQGLSSSYDLLLMRQKNDRRSNVDTKLFFLEWIMDHYNVGSNSILWFEDAVPVVKALNRQGVLTLSCEHFMSNNSSSFLSKKEVPYDDDDNNT